MMWDEVVRDVILPLLEDDSELTTALGGAHIYAAQSSRPVKIPSVEWVLTDDVFTEVFNPIEVQFDYWAPNMGNAVTIESRIRTVLHRETRRTLAGIDLSTMYVDSFTHEAPQPGVIHRSLRFQFEPVRHRYAQSVVS